MKPVPASLVTGALVTVGSWSKGATVGVRQVVGVVTLAVVLSAIDQANARLASAFGLLVVLAVAVVYVQPIAERTGLGK